VTADRVIEILLALLSLAVGFMTYRFSTVAVAQQAKTDRAAVDAGAYERAREIYESALGTLRGDLEACRRDLSETRLQIIALRADNEKLLAELRSVRAELERMEGHQ
jgi:septal ring factor EnvC (AmiA/AmiB activator)